MKNVAITLAVLLTVLTNVANAESAVTVYKTPALILAMSSNTEAQNYPLATHFEFKLSADKTDVNTRKTMHKLGADLDKQLSAKLTREFEYAMH